MPNGLYQFKVMPFGLCNASATFERMMDSLLHRFKWSTCLCYWDDIIVFSAMFDTHLDRLTAILEVFHFDGFQLNLSKCWFWRRHITIFGRILAYSLTLEKFKSGRTSLHRQTPRTFAPLWGSALTFSGLSKAAEIARPLTALLNQDTPFNCSPSQAAAFSKLVTLLTSSLVLTHFDASATTEVRTNASGHGICAVLAQRQCGQNRMITYACRFLSSSEHNYSITKRECLALVWAVAKFRY